MPNALLVDSSRIRELMRISGLTFEQAAVKAGMTSSRLRQLAARDGNARLSTVAGIAAAFGLTDPRDLLLVVRE